ncbi:alpha-L-rhamnosidase A [Thelonectria olida]|uniref:alpha-L-rhamnosidase n=1 Tax=Thelonectria olida TaxID=1576542 RepID=A0A9P9AJS2_9HYPO|nr:alpha-L-rhamnosidase A [Thelonectria olida]
MAVSISQISFEHHRTALGIAETEPRISWRFDGNVYDWEQTAYSLEIIRGYKRQPKFYTFNSSESLFSEWPDDPLNTAEQASVRVRAFGKNGQSPTPWSDWVTVETGLLSSEDWAGAVPIAAKRETEKGKAKRPIYFRKEFHVEAPVQSARLYITSLGLYEAEINGDRVGDAVLAPGWQSYNYRHVYDTYDVTNLIQEGDNAIGAVVGEGWYAGKLSWEEQREFWGDTLGLLSLLTVTYDNGTTLTLPTDTSWEAGLGPIVSSQIYDGETYDSRLEADIKGWSNAGFDADDWFETTQLSSLDDTLSSPDGPPVRRLDERRPESIFKSPSGKTIIDFGQNLVGWIRLTVKGPRGTNITLHHAEVLEDGELALRPLRTAKATDSLILHGKGTQIWEPHFTFHGFRFAQVDGWPDDTPLTTESLTAVVVHSDMEQTGWFECSHELLTKFHTNVQWSMKGNFLSISTDCPQRDERLGWTGDAHAFGPTANFLYNTAGFWRGWHKDMWSEMQRNNSMIVPFFVPTLPTDGASAPAAFWGDVAVGNPWNLYRFFGDEVMLKEQYPQSRNWVDVGIPKKGDGLWNRTGMQFGDWLDPKAPADSPGDATTHAYLVADAYLVRMTELLKNISSVLGEESKADEYGEQHSKRQSAFQKTWMEDGQLTNRTQTAYALAIEFGLHSDDEQSETAAETLQKLVKENNYLVGTGFAGTPALGPALRRIGASGDFYKMLLQTKVPSWLYQVVQNGTTTWERWDSLLANGSVNPGTMTSFNHYAFGSVADWIHQTIGGLAPAEPGWKVIEVAPLPGGNITSADTTFVSGYGEVRAKWWIQGGIFNLNLWVPPNSKALVSLPNGKKTKEVGSGYYEFQQSGYEDYGTE